MHYVVARVDGSVEVLERKNPLELKELQNLVGGYIEMVSISGTLMNRNARNLTAMVNEEGLLIDLPKNPFFSGLRGNVVLGRYEDEYFVGLEESAACDAKHRLTKKAGERA
jgi:hypothetical protein